MAVHEAGGHARGVKENGTQRTSIPRLILVVLATLVLGAHFLRAGHALVALVIVVAPALLAFRTRWAAWTVKGLLLLGTLEWVRTLLELVDVRRALGLPYTRMAVILGSVALVTAVAALLIRVKPALTEKPA